MSCQDVKCLSSRGISENRSCSLKKGFQSDKYVFIIFCSSNFVNEISNLIMKFLLRCVCYIFIIILTYFKKFCEDTNHPFVRDYESN